MFLYLSKLLPLFIYPLGFTCLCLLVSLFFIWKKPKVAASLITLALVILLISSNSWMPIWLARSLEWQNTPKELPNAEAIVVLGGATKSTFPPRPGVDLSEQGDRVIYAAQLYRQQKAPYIILSGGRIDWRGQGAAESADMAEILTSLGIPPEALLQDTQSLNTYQNAVNTRKIMESKGIKRILLVTSALHMPRSLMIFRHQGIEAIAAPTDFLVSEGEIQELGNSPKAALLNILPESNNLQKFTNAIKEYIGIVIYRLRGWL